MLLLCVEDTPQGSMHLEHHPFCHPWGDELLLEGVAEGVGINLCLELRDPLTFVCFGLWKMCVCFISHGNGHTSRTLHVEMSSAVPPSSQQRYYSISKESLRWGDQDSPPPVTADLMSPLLSLSCCLEDACSLWHRVGTDDAHLPPDKTPTHFTSPL